MDRKRFAWCGMTLLACVVAAYALAILALPTLRPGIVRGLLAGHPVAAAAHFAGGALALVAGALQWHSGLRIRHRAIHRWIGRAYLLAILAAGTAGLRLALDAFGGPMARAGFAVLAMAWLVSTLLGWRRARQRQYAAHRRWMARSYALTLAAVTLRLYLPASQMAGIDFQLAYPAIAWLCWVPNLMVAEWWLRRDRTPVLPLASGGAA